MSDFASDSARAKIAELVARFEADLKRYTSPQYNETEVRAQFVDPFFEALGWDVRNLQARFEVSLETRVQVEEAGRYVPKRPDYGFSIQNQTRFFVETKKPSVNLKTNPEPAYQLRRYGWSAKLPVSILTDFQELIIYDCRVQPIRDDAPQKGRLRYYTYHEYIEKWDEIADLFSYEAVLNNKLEAWVQETKQRGTVTVDDAFLTEMETWRRQLAEDIAMHNPGLTRRDLNMAVQTTIDRIVFLRICEDRGVEPYGRLKDFVKGGRVYENLTQLFRQADARYNSGLFHFSDEKGREEPDTLTLNLEISDDTLQHIITRLYYPTSPYEFSVLPADILGQVYERFLGKVIELTPGGGASVTEKPEVRKAGGVYYTPTYIVDYIVQNTVGKLINPTPPPSPLPISQAHGEGEQRGTQVPLYERSEVGRDAARGRGSLTPTDVSRLKILDPACGSGSFLIGAYQYLLDWHLKWYVADGAQKHVKAKRLRIQNPSPRDASPPLARGGAGGGDVLNGGNEVYALTTAEKKRILLNNIYGVDLDQQAVEVTKLSLLLKVLEGETAATAQPELLAERVLPDLGDNIKWGNSLIGPDFYAGKQISMFDEEETYRVKVFDWNHAENGFGAIMSAGGFDAVIGNPPYIRIQTMTEWAAESVAFYKQRYIAASKGNYDIYVIFVEKALSLLNPNGRMGYILPHKFFNAQYGEPLRGLISKGKNLSEVVHFGDQQIFDGATTYTCMLFLQKQKSEYFYLVTANDLILWRTHELGTTEQTIDTKKVTSSEWNFSTGRGVELFEKLTSTPAKLGNIAERMSQGIRTSANEVYVLDLISESEYLVRAFSKKLNKEVELEKKVVSRFLQGREIKPYNLLESKQIVICPYRIQGKQASLIPNAEFQESFPKTWDYLSQNKDHLEAREKGRFRGSDWYVYGRNQNIDLMLLPKILVPDIANRASFALDETGSYTFTSGYGIILKDDVKESQKYVLGLLNSKLLDFYLKQVSTTMRGGYFRYFTQFIEQLPIRTIDFSDPADKARHDKMVALVQSMLDLHKQLPAAASPQIRHTIQAVIDQTDREIDALVHELYGLTRDEIAIVEGR